MTGWQKIKRALYFGIEGIHIILFFGKQGNGIERAIQAFTATKGNVDVNAAHQRLLVRLGFLLGNRFFGGSSGIGVHLSFGALVLEILFQMVEVV